MDNKTLLETRQRAEEMLHQAMKIWHNSDYADDLEGLENDPVFLMLMTALAAGFNGMDSDMENLKQQVMDDFASIFIPYQVDDVVPSMIMVETQPAEGVADVTLKGDSTFVGRGSNMNFMPLLHTRVLNSEIGQVVRLDGRRWKVTIDFPEGISSLDWFNFAIEGHSFRDLKISCRGNELNIIKPWNQYELPYNEAFDFSLRLYNQSPVLNTYTVCIDLLAKRDMFMCCLGEQQGLSFDEDVRSLDFEFEFFGIDDDFVLDKKRLHLNVCPLLNIEIHSVTMTPDKPLARISTDNGQKFMRLMPPSEEQIFNNYTVFVRQVMSDRFNVASLIKLLECLRNKFHTDYYAFQMFARQDGEAMMRNITDIIEKMKSMASSDKSELTEGVYLFLRTADNKAYKLRESVDVRYLTSLGTVNEAELDRTLVLSAPVGLDGTHTEQIMTPILGNESKDYIYDHKSAAAYYIRTSDRIVTPADIRSYVDLTIKSILSIGDEMIRNISVVRRRSEESLVGYDIHVVVTLVNNTIVRKALGDRKSRLESVFEVSLASRSVNIYPISVTIELQ